MKPITDISALECEHIDAALYDGANIYLAIGPDWIELSPGTAKDCVRDVTCCIQHVRGSGALHHATVLSCDPMVASRDAKGDTRTRLTARSHVV